MRIDQQLAEKWIKPGSSVLDLGCGDGELLAHMSQKHQIRAYGLEIDQEKIAIAVSRGLNIIQQDLNLGLSRFADQSFDYVVMAQALQAVDAPDVLLRDMVRVGKQYHYHFSKLCTLEDSLFSSIKRDDACIGCSTIYVV
ncbi:methionine biosynthesis protein MetW [Acinetobacter baumannii]